MVLKELIRKVQLYSGFSDVESRDALEMMVESLSVHLPENERKTFAKYLPEQLQDIALSVYATRENSKQDILEQFMEIQHIGETRAKRQIMSTWKALKDALGYNKLRHIKQQLPKHTVAFLH